MGGTNHAEERQPASEALGLFAPWECTLKRTCGEKVVALPALPALYTAYGLSCAPAWSCAAILRDEPGSPTSPTSVTQGLRTP